MGVYSSDGQGCGCVADEGKLVQYCSLSQKVMKTFCESAKRSVMN